MQNTSVETLRKKNIILQLHKVTVLLEPITESIWYEMKREQNRLPPLSEANKRFCAFCSEQFQPDSTYAKCLECEHTEVLICIECLRCGMESPPHTRTHRFILCDSIGPVLLNDDKNPWGGQEDIQLFNSFIRAHLNQWPELSKDWGRKRTLTEALERLDQFIRNEIGQYVLKDYERGCIKEWVENKHSSKILETFNLVALQNINETSTSSIIPNGKMEFDDTAESNTKDNTRGLDNSKYPTMFEDEDQDVFECDNEQTLSCNGMEAESSSSNEHRKIRKDKLLAAAKNFASEALRSKVRKTSLELSEALNLGNETNSKQHIKKKNFAQLLGDEHQLAELYASASFNPYFYNFPPTPMDAHTVTKFDEEDLQLLTYLPFREEFEHEFKNEAEQLISRIVFPKENTTITEVDRFLNEVRYARFNRYNRLMRIRAAKRGAILEHNLLNEYLNIVKTNISERDKYSVFDDRYFNTKSKEDYFKPLFFQLRQIAERHTINQLAKDIGEMETLKDQIDELKKLQRQGVIKLKGRLKVNSTPAVWSKKRKCKKSENTEQRKAGLRWKRIKRWSKRTHLQHVALDDEE